MLRVDSLYHHSLSNTRGTEDYNIGLLDCDVIKVVQRSRTDLCLVWQFTAVGLDSGCLARELIY
jgi:hypothetical protein